MPSRTFAKARLAAAVTVAGGLLATAGPGPGTAGAAVTGQCGAVVQATAPPTLLPGSFEDSARLRVVPESSNRTLSAGMLVDASAPGLYDDPVDWPALLAGPVIPAGTSVNSYLIHADPVGQPDGVMMKGTIGFDTEILGVIVNDVLLDLSDGLVGLVSGIYPQAFAERGLELKADTVNIVDSHTISLSLRTSTVADQLRVITVGKADPTVLGGYRMVGADGGLFAFGGSSFEGSAGGIKLSSPVVGGAETCGGRGYWLVAADGGIFSYGDARFFGSMGGTKLNRPVVAMAAAPDGAGYWLVASDGGIFNFGSAKLKGSMGDKTLNKPIVGMAATSTGNGYWLVASDGGIFAFGDAAYFGSMGDKTLNKPIVGMAASPSGAGYYMVASDGGIFAFGDAAFFGSTGDRVLNQPIKSMTLSPTGAGYWLVASDGGVFAFGDAAFFGSTGDRKLNSSIVTAF